VTPVGVLTRLADVSLVMPTEVVTVLTTKMVFGPTFIMPITIGVAPSLLFVPPAITSISVLGRTCAREEDETGSQSYGT